MSRLGYKSSHATAYRLYTDGRLHIRHFEGIGSNRKEDNVKHLIALVCFVVALIHAPSAFADGPPRTADAEMACKAIEDQNVTPSACVRATQGELEACKKQLKEDCNKQAAAAKPAAKPAPEVVCKENPGNTGKIRKTGRFSCVCDDPAFAPFVDGNNWSARRCALITDPLLAEGLSKLREMLDKGAVSHTEYDSLKAEVAKLGGQKFFSVEEFNGMMGGIKLELAGLQEGLKDAKIQLKDHEKRISSLEETSLAMHRPFSVIPEVGFLAVSRPTSASFLGANLGLRMRYNGIASEWFFTVGGKAAYGDSQGNGASYAIQGQLGLGSYLTSARKTSLEIGGYMQSHAADMPSNLPGNITTNGRGNALGGYAGFDWKFVDRFNLRLEGGLGSGVDNTVNRKAAYPGGPHASRHEVGLQPYGNASIGYVFDL